jgi:hypothetical protein
MDESEGPEEWEDSEDAGDGGLEASSEAMAALRSETVRVLIGAHTLHLVRLENSVSQLFRVAALFGFGRFLRQTRGSLSPAKHSMNH